MAALTISSVTVKDGGGSNVTAGTATDGTRQLPATGVLGADGALFLPSGASASTQIYVNAGGTKVTSSANFTRPADTTAYTAGDAVSNSTSATTPMTLSSVARKSGGSGYIVGVRLATNLKSITPRFRIHFWNDIAPTMSADNAAFQAKYADEAKRIAMLDLTAMTTPIDTTNSDMSRSADYTIRIPFVAVGSANIYATLETLDAFTPANGQGFTLTVVVDQD